MAPARYRCRQTSPVDAEGEVVSDGPGGRVIRRRGDAVVRPLYPWSSSVHEVLRHLEVVGFSGSPRVLEVSATHESLSWIDGHIPQPEEKSIPKGIRIARERRMRRELEQQS